MVATERGGGDGDDEGGDSSGDEDGDGDGAGDDASDGADDGPTLPRRAAGTDRGDMDASANDDGSDGDDGDVVDSLNLSELRTKLTELGARATVTNSDLEGRERRTATQEAVLRVRLRAAFARL